MHSTNDIAVIAYNRPDKLRRSLSSLDIERVHVFIDGPAGYKDIDAVLQCREVCKAFGVKYTLRRTNIGLPANVIMSVDHVLGHSETVIVIEDDVVISPVAQNFLDRALIQFAKDSDVVQIGLYNPVFSEEKGYVKLPRICSWGWATWRDRWRAIDFNVKEYSDRLFEAKDKMMPDMYLMLRNQYEGRFSAWVARADFSRALNNQTVVYPSVSLSKNFGADGSGLNTPQTTKFDITYGVTVAADKLLATEIPVHKIMHEFNDFYRPPFKSQLRLWARKFGI